MGANGKTLPKTLCQLIWTRELRVLGKNLFDIQHYKARGSIKTALCITRMIDHSTERSSIMNNTS